LLNIGPGDCSALESTVSERLRVVLADDNPAILGVAKNLLEKDFQIEGLLESARVVMREVPRLNPDVLILDISMPEMNGFEITRRLRKENCQSKIVFLTVHEELQFIRAAFDVGATGYVFKSRMNTDLCAAINAVCAGRVFIPTAPIPQ
jgi:DNA-binding NarL/FixJ family response regulator